MEKVLRSTALVASCADCEGPPTEETVRVAHDAIAKASDFGQFFAPLLTYRHDGVVERLQKNLKISSVEAATLFGDMLRFLALTNHPEVLAKGQHLSPPRLIDEAWHTFILFTRDYMGFCQQHFGRYVHHRPFTSKDAESPRVGRFDAVSLARRVYGELSLNWGKASSCSAECSDCDECCDD